MGRSKADDVRREDEEPYRTYRRTVEAAAEHDVRTEEGYYAAREKDPRFPDKPYLEFRNEWEKLGGWLGFLKKVSECRRSGKRKRSYPPPAFPSHMKVAKPGDPPIARLVRAAIEDEDEG